MTLLFGFFSRRIHGLELGTEMETKEKQNKFLSPVLFAVCRFMYIYIAPHSPIYINIRNTISKKNPFRVFRRRH